MNLDNLIIKNINSLSTYKHDIPVREAFIKNVNDYGVRYVDIYFIAKDIKTNSERKMKIKMVDGKFYFMYVDDDEWDKHCKKEELSSKYLEQMKTCTWEGDHEDADFILCNLLEDLGYQELVDVYRKVPKWYS